MHAVAVAAQPASALSPIGSIWSEPSQPWGTTYLYVGEGGPEQSSTAVPPGGSAGLVACSEGVLAASQPPGAPLLGSPWTEGPPQQANLLPCTAALGDSPASATFSTTSVSSSVLPFPSNASTQDTLPQLVSSLAGGTAVTGTPMTAPALCSAMTPDAACWAPAMTSSQLQVVSVSVNGPVPCVGASNGHGGAAMLVVQSCGPASAAPPPGMMLSVPVQVSGSVLQGPLEQQQQQQQQQQGLWFMQVGDQLFPVGSQPMHCGGTAPMAAPAAAAAVPSHDSSSSGGMLWGMHAPVASPQQQQQQQQQQHQQQQHQMWGSTSSPSVMVMGSHAHPHASSGPAAMMQLQSSPGQSSYMLGGASAAGGQMVQGLMQPLPCGVQLQQLGQVVSHLPQYPLQHTPSPQGPSPGMGAPHPGAGPHGLQASAMFHSTSAAATHALAQGLGHACNNAAPLVAGGAWDAAPPGLPHHGSACGLMEAPGLGPAGAASPQLQPRAKVPRTAQAQRKSKAPMAAVVYDAGGVPVAFAPRWAKGRAWDPQASVQTSGAPTKGTGVFIPGMKREPKDGA